MTDIDRISRHCASLLIENENLKIRIEKLEAAIEDMAQYISKADWMQLKKDTHEVWDLGGIND